MNKREFMHGINILHGEEKDYVGIDYKFTRSELRYLYKILSKVNGNHFEASCKKMCELVRTYIQIDSYVKFVLRNTLGTDKERLGM